VSGPVGLEEHELDLAKKDGGGGGPKDIRADISTTGAFEVVGTNQPVAKDDKNTFAFGRFHNSTKAITTGTISFTNTYANMADCTVTEWADTVSDGAGNVADRLRNALINQDAWGNDVGIGDKGVRLAVNKKSLGGYYYIRLFAFEDPAPGDLGPLGGVLIMSGGGVVTANSTLLPSAIPSVITFSGGKLRAITRVDLDGDGVLGGPDGLAELICPNNLDELTATISKPTS
jgi:hypothetical protein